MKTTCLRCAINVKNKPHFSMPGIIPMVSVTFPAGEVAGFNTCALQCRTCAENTGNEEKDNFLHSVEILKKIENRVHGFLQNCARLKKVCKKTSETSAGQSLLGGV
jgi:hypothetical protein